MKIKITTKNTPKVRYGLNIDERGNINLTTYGQPLTQFVNTNLSLRVR